MTTTIAPAATDEDEANAYWALGEDDVGYSTVPWRYWNLDFENGGFTSFGEPMPLLEGDGSEGPGATIWDASLVLTKLLENEALFNKDELRGKTAVELGSGVGMLGIALAKYLEMNVVVTDLAKCLGTIKSNVERNCDSTAHSIVVDEYEWGKPPPASIQTPVDYIFAAELVYEEESVEPLLATLQQLCGEDTIVYLAQQRRNTAAEQSFYPTLRSLFNVSTVDAQHYDQRWKLDAIDVYKLEAL